MKLGFDAGPPDSRVRDLSKGCQRRSAVAPHLTESEMTVAQTETMVAQTGMSEKGVSHRVMNWMTFRLQPVLNFPEAINP